MDNISTKIAQLNFEEKESILTVKILDGADHDEREFRRTLLRH